MGFKLPDLPALGTTPAAGDLLYVVDVSDTSESTDGTSKSVTYSHISSGGGGQPATVTTVFWGSSSGATNGSAIVLDPDTRYWIELFIPFDITVTGLSFGISGSDVDTAAIVELHDNDGVILAHSTLAGTTVPNASYAILPFTTPLDVSAGRYFACIILDNGGVVQLRADTSNNGVYVCGDASGTFGVAANITPGTTYNSGDGLICSTY